MFYELQSPRGTGWLQRFESGKGRSVLSTSWLPVQMQPGSPVTESYSWLMADQSPTWNRSRRRTAPSGQVSSHKEQSGLSFSAERRALSEPGAAPSPQSSRWCLEVLFQLWWWQTSVSGGLTLPQLGRDVPWAASPWLQGQPHWAAMPWSSPLAHTLGEFGFTFSLFFILLILLSPEAAQRANTMARQGKRTLAGMELMSINTISLFHAKDWQEVWLQAIFVENTFRLFDTCFSSSPQSARTWAGETKSNSSLQSWQAKHAALLSFQEITTS